MYLTVYSIAVAVFWATVFTKLAASFRKRIKDLRYFSLYPFMLILFSAHCESYSRWSFHTRTLWNPGKSCRGFRAFPAFSLFPLDL